MTTTPDQPVVRARDLARTQHRAVLVTHRRDGGLQSSPVAVVPGDDGELWVSTRAGSAKARNVARDPAVSLCLVPDAWFGPWAHVDGEARVVRLPDAMDLLVEYYRRAAGEHADWDEYREAMRAEERVVLRVSLAHAVLG